MEAVAVLVAVAAASRVVAEAEAKFDKLKRFCNFVSNLGNFNEREPSQRSIHLRFLHAAVSKMTNKLIFVSKH